jgi:hypothetical protein
MRVSTPVRNAVFVALLMLFGTIAGLGGYYAGGRSDAIDDARPLARLADRLIAQGRDGTGLGPGREAVLLAVADPDFADHTGLDLDRPAPGMILTRDLAAWLGFDRFEAGTARIRQLGYASGLERKLSKPRLLALWLETVDMGRSPRGWMKGFYTASRNIYGRTPQQLSDEEFLRLVAVATAPRRFALNGRDPALEARLQRIRKLLAGQCHRMGETDPELASCALT